MNAKQRKELKQDLSLGYTAWMQQIHIKWGNRVDKDELRFMTAKILANHAMDRIYDTHHRKVKRIAKDASKIQSLIYELNNLKASQAEDPIHIPMSNTHPITDNIQEI